MGVCGSKESQSSAAAGNRVTGHVVNRDEMDSSQKQNSKEQSYRNAIQGRKLGGDIDTRLPPKEAAAKAAEQRQQKEEERASQGVISRRLHAEKKKSGNMYLREQAAQTQREQQTATLVYD